MEKLKRYLDIWMDGGNVKGVSVSLSDIRELARVYESLLRNENAAFINIRVKEVLHKCKIKTIKKGIGWEALFNNK